jgi:hypothetical protein
MIYLFILGIFEDKRDGKKNTEKSKRFSKSLAVLGRNSV